MALNCIKTIFTAPGIAIIEIRLFCDNGNFNADKTAYLYGNGLVILIMLNWI